MHIRIQAESLAVGDSYGGNVILHSCCRSIMLTVGFIGESSHAGPHVVCGTVVSYLAVVEPGHDVIV